MKSPFSAVLLTALGSLLVLLAGAPIRVQATTFNIADGDVAALKMAIETSNSNNQDDVINLAANATYTLGPSADLDQSVNGPNGLRAILPDRGHKLTINGNGATIARSTAPYTAAFRIFYISLGANVTLKQLNIINGFADHSEGSTIYSGGGVLNDRGTLTLADCRLSQNRAKGNGGGICNYQGALTLANCTFSQNSASLELSLNDGGGGVYNYHGVLTLANCTFSQNHSFDGGGIMNFGGDMSLVNCTLSQNDGDYYGGGIKMFGGTANLVCCTLSENDAGIGGGIWSYASTLRLGNNILANGRHGNITSEDGTVISDGFNLCNDDGGGYLTAFSDRINTDPKLSLAGLKNNGGPTPTIALRSTSPALDQGKDLSLTRTDQLGQPRPVDHASIANVVSGDGSDIGAFEVQKLPLLFTPIVAPAPFNFFRNPNIAKLVFSSANRNAISLFDADLGNVVVTVTLSVTSGTLTLGTTEGISIPAGVGGDGIDDPMVIFSGTPDQINRALEGLSYTPSSSGTQMLILNVTTPEGSFTGNVTFTIVDSISPLDVSSQASLTRSGFRFNRATQRYQQTVTLMNVGAAEVAGPVSLALDRLSNNATLFGAAGVTAGTLPAGSPYLNVNVGPDDKLSPGESATLTLEFTNPTNGGITYTARVLAGPGTR